jgi:sulfur relay (sulfurtransferase) DsrC/TusE family protein
MLTTVDSKPVCGHNESDEQEATYCVLFDYKRQVAEICWKAQFENIVLTAVHHQSISYFRSFFTRLKFIGIIP